MKILVTGNSGFIGTFLTDALIKNGYEVHGMDLNPPGDGNGRFAFIRGSVLRNEDILKAGRGCETIINLAAKHHDFGVTKEEFFAVNEQGTLNVLDCADRLGIRKLIFYSSVAVYGDPEHFADEETTPKPVNVYGESKLAGERRIYTWSRENPAREVCIIRPTVIFGPRNFGNMFNLVNNIYKRRFVFVGKGENIKSVGYVENLVGATMFLLKGMKPGLEVYNYADYPEMTVADTVNTITACLGRGAPKFKLPLGPAIAGASIFDILGKITGYNFPITAYRIRKFNTVTRFKADKIRKAGFEQGVAVEEGFKRMIEWYLEDLEGRGL